MIAARITRRSVEWESAFGELYDQTHREYVTAELTGSLFELVDLVEYARLRAPQIEVAAQERIAQLQDAATRRAVSETLSIVAQRIGSQYQHDQLLYQIGIDVMQRLQAGRNEL